MTTSEHADGTTNGNGLQLSETDKEKFLRSATSYGVELYGGTAEERIDALTEQFDQPLVTVDCREVDTSGEVNDIALREFGVDDGKRDQLSIRTVDLQRKIKLTESHFAVLELDSLDYTEQRNVARLMKSIAEGLEHDDIMLGFTCSMKGAVTTAEPDLSMRVRSWQVGPETDEYGPLSDFTIGDEIKTSARETTMEVKSVGETFTNKRKLIAENHHGEYELHHYHNGGVTLYVGSEMIRDVEVTHAG